LKGIKVCSIKGSGPLQRGENYKNVKMGLGHLKIFLRTLKPIKAEFYMRAFLHRMKARWLESWPPRVGWGKWK
jgi:hypothetical protein